MDKTITQQALKSVMTGLILYVFSGFVGGIVTTFVLAGSLLSGSAAGMASSMTVPVIFALLTLVGLVMYMMGVNKLGGQMDEIGKGGLKMVFFGLIVNIVAALLYLIPVMGGTIGGIFALIAAILMFVGFNKLKSTTSLNEMGIKGAGQLSLAALLFLIAEIIDFIPFLGWASFILMVLYYIFLFLGWSKVKNSLA